MTANTTPDPQIDETPDGTNVGSSGHRRPEEGGAPAGREEAAPATGGKGAAGAGGSGGFGT